MKKPSRITMKSLILTQKLKAFGLDPRDWLVSEMPDGLIIIQNVFENEVTLLGRAIFKRATWEWNDIQLAEV